MNKQLTIKQLITGCSSLSRRTDIKCAKHSVLLIVNSAIVNFFLFLSISSFLFLAGCARTVTVRPVIGNRMSVEISFRGDIDTAANRYYLVFGSSSPQLMEKNRYFFAPGEDYLQGSLDVFTQESQYYDYFFSSWDDFIVLKDNTYQITNGPFSSLSAHSSYVPSFLDYRALPSSGSEDAKKIKLEFDLSKFPGALPAEIYFNFLSVDADRRLRDKLGAADNKISVNIGSSTHNISELPDPSIAAGLDIISWQVEIQ